MKQAQSSMNWRGVALATGGGAALILVAAQLLAKPAAPRTGTPAVRTNAGRTTAAPAESAAPRTTAVPRMALAGDPPVRELFRPLVVQRTQQSGASVRASGAPPLPRAGGRRQTTAAAPANSSGPTPTLPAAESPAAPAGPTGPTVSDIQMLGVVEMDGSPQVLLKKTSTGESRYFPKGEEAFGFTVQEIKDSEVTLAREGKTDTVRMSSAVTIEGPGGTVSAGSSGFNGGGGGRGGRRGGIGGGFGGGGFGGGGDAQPASTTTWAERLKNLEATKATMDPARYERLRKYMAERAAQEKK